MILEVRPVMPLGLAGAIEDQPADLILYAPWIAMGVWLARLAKAGAMR